MGVHPVSTEWTPVENLLSACHAGPIQWHENGLNFVASVTHWLLYPTDGRTPRFVRQTAATDICWHGQQKRRVHGWADVSNWLTCLTLASLYGHTSYLSIWWYNAHHSISFKLLQIDCLVKAAVIKHHTKRTWNWFRQNLSFSSQWKEMNKSATQSTNLDELTTEALTD